MRLELQQQNLKVKFVAVNSIDANTPTDQKQLTDRCAFPLFQDVDTMQAWHHHNGQKDDLYIYNAQGQLVAHLPFAGPVNTDLSTDEGYNNLKQAILNVK
ncbi:MAG: hypothetical protein EP343_12330 [Deltaproteobacteria bacterium]|nr:MAG: hypothetical protein EP343_12330 [Deltaproteobacteria bacterium]